ncbi:Guanine nucleotide-binding protein, beta subunit [Parasponia andersonii]|uniref:Guanine nucleotide-binding protein, beta subunit n=1 Tax=Parasponia andersonii TaxID=3476 RepID=A0A2P5C9U5_PARAD|nr:Guanine nucleotide-binding protein, beta subunit [Parasponia andersonii]
MEESKKELERVAAMSDSDDDSVVKVNPRFQSEYNEWKKKCPFFYDFIISHPLPRTSLTVHWSTMTPLTHPHVPSLALHRLLFNSYCRRTRTSYLRVTNAPLPTVDYGPIPILPKVEVNQNLVLDSRLAMARFMPQNPNIVGVRTQSTDVYFHPDVRLTGFAHNVHGHGGAGLAWNEKREGYILSSKVHNLSFHPYNEWIVATASSDETVRLFDMRKLREKIYNLGGHTDKVSKVEWNPNKGSVLASCGDDRRVIVWDINRIGDEILRGESKAKCPSGLLFSHEGHKDKVTDFSWNEHEPWVISSVAKDGTLQVWKLAQSIRGEDHGGRAIDE